MLYLGTGPSCEELSEGSFRKTGQIEDCIVVSLRQCRASTRPNRVLQLPLRVDELLIIRRWTLFLWQLISGSSNKASQLAKFTSLHLCLNS